LNTAAAWRDLARGAARRFGADPARVVAAGPGGLAERLALAEPEVFPAVAAWGGPLELPALEPSAPRRYALLGRADDASLAVAAADAAARGIPTLDARGLAPAEQAERLAAWTWWLAAW
jgi:poly(3-hydroxybutyrate) depolymerase